MVDYDDPRLHYTTSDYSQLEEYYSEDLRVQNIPSNPEQLLNAHRAHREDQVFGSFLSHPAASNILGLREDRKDAEELHPSSKPSIEKLKPPMQLEDEDDDDDADDEEEERDRLQQKRVKKDRKRTRVSKKKLDAKLDKKQGNLRTNNTSSIIMTRSQKQKDESSQGMNTIRK